MRVGWRHRIVRIRPELGARRRALLRAFDDGWMFVHESPAADGGSDLVFRRAAFHRRPVA